MRRLVLVLAALALAVMLAGGVALAAAINGTSGDDELQGTSANDTITGHAGDDTVRGADGDDTIDGGIGHDPLLRGDGGNDEITGGDGEDTLWGGGGADLLRGSGDADYIADGPSSDAAEDRLNGGIGNDEIVSANYPAVRDVVLCGDGTDTVEADSLDLVETDCEIVNIAANVRIDFAEDRTVAQALQIAQAENSSPTELVARYARSIDDEYSAGYLLAADDPVPSAASVSQSMIDMFRQDRQLLQGTPDDPTADPAVETSEQAAIDHLSSVIDSLQNNGARVDDMMVQTETSVAELEQNPAIATAERISVPSDETPATRSNNEGKDFNWAPKWGYVKTTCCYNGYRYVYQKWYWNKWRMQNLKSIRSNLTWEQEAIYNRDRGNYLGRSVGWSGNMPADYMDFAAEPPWRPARIWNMGSSNAQGFRAETYYYTSIRTKWGRQDSDGAGVRGQHGHRSPAGCYRWYCTYEDATDLILDYNPPAYRAPGQTTWYSDV